MSNNSIFVSSTFSDMQRERDILSRLVLPRVRSRLGDAGRNIRELDLRWGITNVMSRNEGAVNICIEEVERCSPFVVGMIGHRVGWSPTLTHLRHRFREILGRDARGRGLTELELTTAVRARPHQSTRRPVIFMRSAELSKAVHNEIAITGDEIAPGGVDRVEEMRERLRSLGSVEIIDYCDFEAFEKLAEESVYRQHIGVTQNEVQKSWVSSELEMPRERAVKRIQKSIIRRPTLLSVRPGEGATYLATRVCRLAGRRALHIDGRETPIDAVPTALSSTSTLSSDRFGIADAMMQLPARSTIVFDHFDDAFESEATSDLTLLPSSRILGHSILVVARSPRVRAQAESLNWAVVEIDPLSRNDAERYLRAYLVAYGKHLTRAQLKRLGSAQWRGRIGTIRLVADELRRYGSFELLGARIDQLASHQHDAGLAADVISGLSEAFSDPWRDAPQRLLLALSQSLRGLEQDRLLAACGGGHNALPVSIWSALQLSMPSAFREREGRVDLASGPVRDLVLLQAQSEPQTVANVARNLERAFADANLRRRVEEMPGLAIAAGGEVALRELLVDPVFAVSLAEIGEVFAASWLDQLSADAATLVAAGWLEALEQVPGTVLASEAWRLARVAARAGLGDQAVRLAELDESENGERRDLSAELAYLTGNIVLAKQVAERFFLQLENDELEDRDVPNGLFVLGQVAEGKAPADTILLDRLSSWLSARSMGKAQAGIRCQIMLYRGQILLGAGKPKSSLDCLARAEKYARGVGNARFLCSALERSSAAALELGRFQAARRAAVECRAIASATGLSEFEASAFERLIECHMRRSDWTEAYRVAEEYIERSKAGLVSVERARTAFELLENV